MASEVMVRVPAPRFPPPRQLTLEDAFKMAQRDKRQVAKAIGLKSPVLQSREEVDRIEQAGIRLLHENRSGYVYYEIGHLFIVDHLIASVGDRINLSGKEERLLRAVLGRLHYNPPAREFFSKSQAAEKLSKEGERGAMIFTTLKEEVDKFFDKWKSEIHSTDTFGNPLFDIVSSLYGKRSFAEIAAYERDNMRLLKGGKPFYR